MLCPLPRMQCSISISGCLFFHLQALPSFSSGVLFCLFSLMHIQNILELSASWLLWRCSFIYSALLLSIISAPKLYLLYWEPFSSHHFLFIRPRTCCYFIWRGFGRFFAALFS